MKAKRPLIDAFKYAWAGIRHTSAHERNFRVHIIAAMLAIIACVIIGARVTEFMMVIFAIFLVLCMELVNTAVEAVVDLVCGKKPHPLAKIAKDAAAGAVLLAAINALAVAGVIAYNFIIRL